MLGRRLVRRVQLLVVVAAALEVPDLVVGHALDQLAGARVTAEEVLPDVLARLALVGLVVAGRHDVHEVYQPAVAVRGEQGVPFAAPDDLDDVPAGAPEERLQLLDDLAVAAHRAVEALQVAVDHEGQVVELLAGRHPDRTERLDLVHLAVAQERPDALLAGVLDTPVVQVAVVAGLVDRVQRAEAHADRRELPELVHQPGVRVGRQGAVGMGQLLAEAVQVVLAEPALEMGPGVHARRGVALEEEVVATAGGGSA